MPNNGQNRPLVRLKESKKANRRSATVIGTARQSRTDSQMIRQTTARTPTKPAIAAGPLPPAALAAAITTPTATKATTATRLMTSPRTKVTTSTRSSSMPRRK